MSFFFDPLPRRSFDFVSIDFPWPWDAWSAKGLGKSPNAHYGVMTLDEIARTAADELLAPGGVMGMWATWPLIGKQHLICERSFGLEVKSGACWSKRGRNGKLRIGPGKIFRTVCEPVLIATRKDHQLRGPSARNLIETIAELEFPGLARQHSRKPDEWYQLIESLTPGWRRADVFARESREGWTTWGKERNKFDKKK
jgi:N6-adenosine-specific RNA methylase IME4